MVRLLNPPRTPMQEDFLPHRRWTKRACAGLGAAGLVVSLASPVGAQSTGAAANGEAGPQGFGPKNVIFLIGDGMGYHQIDTASLYEHGVGYSQFAADPATGEVENLPGEATQVYQNFPVQVGAATYQDGNLYDPARAWGDFDWVLNSPPDSAATATALATGVRTYNAAIGVGPEKEPVRNLTERAQELGKASGVVSSVPFSHATPSGFVAHNEHRDNYHGIAKEMLWEHEINVIMGGGHPYYDSDAQNRDEPEFTYLAEAEYEALAGGQTQFELIEEPGEFNDLATSPDTPEHVFGLPRVDATLQYDRSGDDIDPDGNAVPGSLPYTAPANEGVPTLVEMTNSALNILDNASDEGMFLMVEGGAIDWASHANVLNRQIEEQLAFNDTIESVVDWVERESSWNETLVVVTADHETGYLTGSDSDPAWSPIEGEQGELPEVSWHTGGHTNSLVPVFAKGPGATRLEYYASHEDPVRGAYLENIHLAWAVFDYWGRG